MRKQKKYSCVCECSSDEIQVNSIARDLAETEAYRIFAAWVDLGDARANCNCKCHRSRDDNSINEEMTKAARGGVVA